MSWTLEAAERKAATTVPVAGGESGAARAARQLAAVATAFGGAAHYAAIPEHRAEWWVAATVFTLVGAVQLGWGVLAWRVADRALLALGAGANLLVLAGWLVSRTVGLPVGPHAGTPEPVGAVDLAAGVAEAVALAAIIAVVALSLRRRGHPEPGRIPA